MSKAEIKNSIEKIRELVIEMGESCPFNEEAHQIEIELHKLEDLIGV